MKKLILPILILASLNVYSLEMLDMSKGDWGSGGGNGLVCFTTTEVADAVRNNKFIVKDEHLSSIKSIEVYDLYEAKKRRGISSENPEIIEIGDSEEFYEYFDRLSKRFENHNYLMSYLVTMGKEMIPDSNIIFNSAAVKNQNDLGNVSLPQNNCLIITMAAQVNYFNHYQVHIDERLFFHPMHSRQSQATLMLHELVYGVGRKLFKHTDSGSTRSLLRYFISYHSSVNEGTVSNALVDLKFSDGILEGTENFFSRFSKSEIMVKRAGVMHIATIVLAYSMIHSFPYSDEKIIDLLDESLESAENEGWSNEVFKVHPADQFSIFMLRYTINLGLNKSPKSPIWIDFSKKLKVVDNLFIEYTDLLIEDARVYMNSIKNNSKHITALQNSILSSQTDQILRVFQMITRIDDDENNLNELVKISLGKRENDFIEVLFDSIISRTCESSMGEEPQCYGPLILNNIIPKA